MARPTPTNQELRAAWDHHRERQAEVMRLAAEAGFPGLDTRLGEIVPGRYVGPGHALTGYAISDASPEQLAEIEARLRRHPTVAGLLPAERTAA